MPILAKVAYAAGVRPAPLLAWRFAIATVLFALLLTGRAPALPWRQRLVLWGVGSVFVMNAYTYFRALALLPASTLALLLYSYPVLVTLISGLLGHDPFTPRGLVAAAMAFVGCALTVGQAPSAGPGVVLGISTAFIYATYILLGSRFASGVPSLVAAAHVAQASFVFCTVWAVLDGGLRLPASASAWVPVIVIAVFSTVVALYGFLGGLARIGPARAAVFSSFELVVTMVLAVAVLRERVGWVQWTGAALILGAVVFQNAPALRRLPPSRPGGGLAPPEI
jgi:drug/metabolite transporter (DMT)-like permease